MPLSASNAATVVDSGLVLSAVEFAMGRQLTAEQSLQAVLSFQPDNVLAEFNLGVLYYAGHREGLAEQHWQRTLVLDPSFGEAHRTLCYLFYTQKQFAEALRHAERAQGLGVDIPRELVDELVRATN